MHRMLNKLIAHWKLIQIQMFSHCSFRHLNILLSRVLNFWGGVI